MRHLRSLLPSILLALLFPKFALAIDGDQLLERFFTACPVSMKSGAPLQAAAAKYSWRALTPAELDIELRANSEFMISSYLPAVRRTIKDRSIADHLVDRERDRQNARKAMGFASQDRDVSALNFEGSDSILWTRDLTCIVQTTTPVDLAMITAKIAKRLGDRPAKWNADYAAWTWEVDPERPLTPTISIVTGGRHHANKVSLILSVVLVEGS